MKERARLEKKIAERSIDSLQRLYAVIVALTIAEAIRTITPRLIADDFTLVPQFLALLVTIIPFFHGMNRHLDATYIYGPRPTTGRHEARAAILMIDVAIFVLEGMCFFVLAVLLDQRELFFWVLLYLMIADGVWGVFSFLAHEHSRDWRKSSLLRWSVLNVLLAVALWTLLDQTVLQSPLAFAAAAAVARTIADYIWNRAFYFPMLGSAAAERS